VIILVLLSSPAATPHGAAATSRPPNRTAVLPPASWGTSASVNYLNFSLSLYFFQLLLFVLII
jgi:hypothetical protein